MLQTLSIGAGGGSIAWINPIGDQLGVGPRSAGSMPGPVCYDQGGTEPTVTDADIVLGYINPDTYYGGRMPLNRDKAERAIREKIAGPLGVSVEQAAALIRRVVDQNMASAIKREIHLRGYHPEDFILFAFGGAGPTHVSGFLGDLAKAVVFRAAPVFCALGSSIMDIVHVYETSKRMIFMERSPRPSPRITRRSTPPSASSWTRPARTSPPRASPSTRPGSAWSSTCSTAGRST
jgi:N-methylhydantoinase A/acetone carboxylase, beta subunit